MNSDYSTKSTSGGGDWYIYISILSILKWTQAKGTQT